MNLASQNKSRLDAHDNSISSKGERLPSNSNIHEFDVVLGRFDTNQQTGRHVQPKDDLDDGQRANETEEDVAELERLSRKHLPYTPCQEHLRR